MEQLQPLMMGNTIMTSSDRKTLTLPLLSTVTHILASQPILFVLGMAAAPICRIFEKFASQFLRKTLSNLIVKNI